MLENIKELFKKPFWYEHVSENNVVACRNRFESFMDKIGFSYCPVDISRADPYAKN